MTNPYRGEVPLTVNGQARTMRLTLGALAELEQALGEDTLVGLVERFESGGFSAADLVTLLAAGLGETRDVVANSEIDGGPLAAARAAATLLRVTFQIPDPA
ncbi:MAG: gene transfer agent family protein [Pseudomonadota bacterium]